MENAIITRNNITEEGVPKKEVEIVPVPTLFMDLDGTIIETKSGETFPKDKDDWKFKKGILESIYGWVSDNDCNRLVIITNQAGVNDGYITPLELHQKVELINTNIDCYCSIRSVSNDRKISSRGDLNIILLPSLSMTCNFRKPKADSLGLIDKLFKSKYNEVVDIEKSIMVGDASGTIENVKIPISIYDTLKKEDIGLCINKIYRNRIVNLGNEIITDKEAIVSIRCFSNSDKKFAENANLNM